MSTVNTIVVKGRDVREFQKDLKHWKIKFWPFKKQGDCYIVCVQAPASKVTMLNLKYFTD